MIWWNVNLLKNLSGWARKNEIVDNQFICNLMLDACSGVFNLVVFCWFASWVVELVFSKLGQQKGDNLNADARHIILTWAQADTPTKEPSNMS